ncbi:MAG: hypothetical protein QXS38_01545 [Candidatus Pacearchaeota archaeon]
MLKRTKQIVYIALIVIMILAIIGAVYFGFIYIHHCSNYECWQKYMSRCSRAAFINDEPEASWRYEIKGTEGKQCVIEVKLLLAKKGELGIEKLIGQKMTCYYPTGVSAYAEKDLTKCHGLLKEELQNIIINKLHSYILENLGKIGEELKSI